MEKMRKAKEEYLKRMFKDICGLDFESIEDESLYFNEFLYEAYWTVQWFEKRGFTPEKAEQKAREKWQTILMEDNEIVHTILNYIDIDECISFDESKPTQETLLRRYIDYLSSTFSRICDFSIENGELVDPHKVVAKIREVFITNEIVNGKGNTDETPEEEKLTITTIALFYIYMGTVVTKENATDLVKRYGHSSGDKLYNEYTSFIKVANRRRLPEQCTARRYYNRVALFEKVIDLLPEDKKKAAQIDLNHIKAEYGE